MEPEKIQALQADRDGAYASLHTLQVQLDAALQKHQDDAAAHAKAIADLTAKHATALAMMQADAKAAKETYQADFTKLVQKNAAESTASDERYAAGLVAQANSLAIKHAAEIATLKASVLVPALKDMQARQAADLAAKHAAELQSLAG
jgi:hypothetical protein